jgi:hypothetical protein
MSGVVYQIFCEWDIGQENMAYSTEALAWEEAAEMLNLQFGEEITVQEAVGRGLLSVQPLIVR